MRLTLADIATTADLFRPVYDRTAGRDGYVSLEVNPKLAADTERTIAEARRLFAALDRPNVMIKIPGTPEGMPAIEQALSEGININVTLIFAVDAYREIMQAYLSGVGKFIAGGGDPRRVASVASFFVSRVDTAVDKQLSEIGGPDDLHGQAAVANSKLAYAAYREVFEE
jgi:transaldolase